MNATSTLQPRDLYRFHSITDPQISPDGTRVAFVLTRVDEEKDTYISNIYMGERGKPIIQFTSGDKDSAPRWSPDGRYLAFLSGRKEKAQIHLMPTAGGESIAITDRKLGAGVPFWSPDGASIAFIGVVSTTPDADEADEKDKDKKKAPTRIIGRSSYKLDNVGFIWSRRRHLFCIDAASRSVRQLTDGDFHDDSPSWSPDSRHIVFVSNRDPRWDVSLDSDVYLIPRDAGDAVRLTSGHSFHSPVFRPDGARIAVVGLVDPEEAFSPARLYSIDREGRDIQDEQGDWDGSLGNDVASDVVRSADGLDLCWRDDGIYFLGTVRGQCHIFRAAHGTVSAVTSGPQTITDFSIATDGTLGYTRADATHPAEVYLGPHGQVEQLTQENGFLQTMQIVQPERVRFRGACGEKSEGWLLRPQGSTPCPLIVYIHGGPATAHGEAFFFEYQLLAAQGFGVFFPNIHGSSSYGRAYQTSIRHDWANLDYQDVLAGTDEAARRDWVDEDRLGIVGGSYGGYMTNWVMTHSDRFKAGLAERCISNMVSFYGTTDFGWLWNRAWGVYPEEDVQRLWDMSPIKYVENVQGALMIVHSERDDRCPMEQAEQMFNALRRLGKETKMIVYPEETHELSRSGKPSRRVERLDHELAWFKEHL